MICVSHDFAIGGGADGTPLGVSGARATSCRIVGVGMSGRLGGIGCGGVGDADSAQGGF
jgi:hypothetical protein